jgi:hypothetical protein
MSRLSRWCSNTSRLSRWRPRRAIGRFARRFEVEGDHYVAVVTHGKGVIPNGTRIPVPNSNVKSIFHVGSKFESTRAVAGIALTDQTAIAAVFVELVRDQDARHGNLKSSA